MLARLRQFRPAFHAALAALVLAALSHCSWEESRELVQWSRTVALHRQGLPTPLQKPVHDCDHEFGCICRGATLVHAIAVTDWQPQATDFIQLHFCELPTGFVEIETFAGQFDDEQDLVPPLSGRQLRALYASLVI
jgi:hypothetical protein